MSAVSTYRCGTSSTADVVSPTTNATLATNKNMIFWNSPIPNRKNVKGISAATGMFRPNTLSGAMKARTGGKQAATTPSGTPTRPLNPKPRQTRPSVTSVFATSRRWPNTSGNARAVSSGLGSMAGLMKRLSASPAVATNQAASTQATQVAPQRAAVRAGISPLSGLAGTVTAPRNRDSAASEDVIPFPPSRP